MKKDVSSQELKQQFLRYGKKIIKRQEWYAKNSSTISPGQKQMFDLLGQVISKTEDPIQMSFMEGDVSVKITDILNSVSSGQITPTEAQKLMEMVAKGYEMVELKNLMEKMESAGLLENKR